MIGMPMTLNIKALMLSAASLALVACGGGGSSAPSGGGGGTGGGDTVAPMVSFSPNAINVTGRATGESTLDSSDNVGVTATSVNCTNNGTFSNGTFTAPDVDVETTSVCTAIVRDAANNRASATLTVTITPGSDITDPTVSVTVPNTNVSSGGTADLGVEANDNRGAPTVTVTCDNGGVWDNGVFTAPTVTEETTVTCTVTAEDDGGNTAVETVVFTILPPDTTDPVISFPSGNTLSVASGQTANYAIDITDNSGETIEPTVTCDNGGTWENGVFTAPAVTENTTITCTVTAEDSGGNSVTETFTVNVTAPTSNKVTISGNATFDFVPHNTSTNGLDYANTSAKPIRGATIQLVDGSNAVLQAAVTDDSGNYSFEVDPSENVRVRVLSEIVSTTGAMWDVKVVNSGNNIYALQGALNSSGTVDSTRDLHADSGWGGTSYTTTRQAAPFAILDPLYTTVTKFAAVDPDINFPRLFVDWAPSNNQGSFFFQGRVTLLGDENNDTDEYDPHVVVHEWGHYFESVVSRADSIGGPHTGGDRLDPRLAFGEGWGYALAAMILDDPNARDSGGTRQGNGFNIPVDRNNNVNPGWFSEATVQSVLYDLYDAPADGADNVEAGLGPIYEVLTSQSYINSPYFTTIFLFADEYRQQQSATSAGLDALLVDQDVNGTGPSGAGETNDGNIASSVPVYNVLTSGGSAVQICSVNDAGPQNKLGNRAFLEFTPPTSRAYDLSMIRTSGATGRDPDFHIYRNGVRIQLAESGVANSETATANLTGGTKYMIIAFDFNNVEPGVAGDACYNFTAN